MFKRGGRKNVDKITSNLCQNNHLRRQLDHSPTKHINLSATITNQNKNVMAQENKFHKIEGKKKFPAHHIMWSSKAIKIPSTNHPEHEKHLLFECLSLVRDIVIQAALPTTLL